MKKLLLWLFLAVSVSSYAQIPSYYNDVNLSQSGNDLKDELAVKIIATHTTFLSYTPGVWNALQQADLNPSNSNEVILIYGHNDSDGNVKTDRTRGKFDNGGSVGDWNREHVFAKSLANPNLGTSGAGADAHNLRPCDFQQNSTRNNRKFGTGSGAAAFINSNGDWYPGDEWKGDVARMIMYMYLRYGDRCLPVNVGTGSSVSVDTNMITLFLQWNADDPVSTFEANRNDVLAGIQGNRNPFIDNPAFATQIWGGPQAEDKFGDGGGGNPGDGGGNPGGGSTDELFFSEYIEGSSNNKALEIANFTGSSVNLSIFSIKKQTNGAGSWSSPYSLSGTLSDGDVFVIANSSANSTIQNAADITTGSGIVTFNGNDPVGLFKNNVLIDIIGDFNGGSANFAQNVTLRRKASITSPNTNYTEAEWDEFATDSTADLGSHTVNGGGSSGGGTSGSTTVLNEGYFESGLDGWVDGGGDCARYSGSFSYEGNYSIRLRDNSSTASSMSLYDIDVTPYDQVEIDFYFYANSMETGEDFWVRYQSGGSWQTVRAYVSGTDFVNGRFYNATVTLDSANYDFVSDANFRFQCDASANADQVYIDQVTITGIVNASARMNTAPTEDAAEMFAFTDASQESMAEEFTIYPNPVANQLEVKIYADASAEYQIHSVVGRVVKAGTLGNKTINVSNLKAGMYILQVNDGDEIVTKKFIKR